MLLQQQLDKLKEEEEAQRLKLEQEERDRQARQ